MPSPMSGLFCILGRLSHKGAFQSKWLCHRQVELLYPVWKACPLLYAFPINYSKPFCSIFQCESYLLYAGFLGIFGDSWAGLNMLFILGMNFSKAHSDEHITATACHQLGNLAQERRNFDDLSAVGASLHQGMAMKNQVYGKYYAALIFHQLGMEAQHRHDLRVAEADKKGAGYMAETYFNRNSGTSGKTAFTPGIIFTTSL